MTEPTNGGLVVHCFPLLIMELSSQKFVLVKTPDDLPPCDTWFKIVCYHCTPEMAGVAMKAYDMGYKKKEQEINQSLFDE